MGLKMEKRRLSMLVLSRFVRLQSIVGGMRKNIDVFVVLAEWL
jgi:hypothetical protein